jgi:hypothetical protein
MSSIASNPSSTDNFEVKSDDSTSDQLCEIQALMRSFLKEHTAYDVLPVSYRLIVFDTRLLVKKALNALVQNGILLFSSIHISPLYKLIYLLYKKVLYQLHYGQARLNNLQEC